jgi:hypothetical protein
VVDYLEVIDSERTYFEAELAESSVRRAALTSYIRLYKALGGGWSEEEEVEEGEVDEKEGVEEAEADAQIPDEGQTPPEEGDAA